MSRKKDGNLGKNILYMMIYQVITVFSPLLVTPYISRVLGADALGRYSYAHSIAYYFVLLAGLGISSHGTRRIAETKNNPELLNKTFSDLFWLHLMISAAVTLIYLIIIASGVNSDNAALSFIMTFYVLSAVADVKWLFYGLENFRVTVLRSIIIKIVYILLIFALVHTQNDLMIYTLIMAFVCFFLAEVTLFVMIPRYVRIRKPDFAAMKREIAPVILLFVPSTANLLLRHFDKIMLGILSTYEQLGLYENTDKVFMILITFITAVSDVMLPRISNLLSSEEKSRADRLLKIILRVSIIVSCAFAFGIIAVAGEFVPLFFGEDFTGCISLLSWIAPSLIMLTLSVTIRKQYLIPRYKEKVYTTATVTSLIVNILANAVLIPRFHAMGAVYGTLISEMTVVVIQFVMIRRELSYRVYIMDVVRFSVIGGIMVLCVRAVAGLPLGGMALLSLEVLTGAAVYILLSLLLMVATHDELLVTARSMMKRSNKM